MIEYHGTADITKCKHLLVWIIYVVNHMNVQTPFLQCETTQVYLWSSYLFVPEWHSFLSKTVLNGVS